jgi:hypothetical protein
MMAMMYVCVYLRAVCGEWIGICTAREEVGAEGHSCDGEESEVEALNGVMAEAAQFM